MIKQCNKDEESDVKINSDRTKTVTNTDITGTEYNTKNAEGGTVNNVSGDQYVFNQTEKVIVYIAWKMQCFIVRCHCTGTCNNKQMEHRCIALESFNDWAVMKVIFNT